MIQKIKMAKGVFAGLLLIFSASTAQAIPLTFNLTTDLQAPTSTDTFAGFITFDSADVFAGNTVFASNFLDWEFSWGTDLFVDDTTIGSDFVSGYDSITFDGSAGITTWSICVSTPADCLFSSNPGFFSDSNGTLNNTYDGGRTNSGVQQSWSRAPSVPEPSILALLSLGLIGLGLARKNIA